MYLFFLCKICAVSNYELVLCILQVSIEGKIVLHYWSYFKEKIDLQTLLIVLFIEIQS